MNDERSSSSDVPVLALIILDGWGIGREEPGNALLAANTPTMDRLLTTYPHTTLDCSGLAVGLPAGQMGNSEVGHINLGAGFVVYQWLTRIDRAIDDGTLADNPVLQSAFSNSRSRSGTLHFMGLVSDGGVHSHVQHLQALVRMAVDAGCERIAIHVFTDGRDTLPTSGLGFVTELEATLRSIGHARIATVCGRYYAMDRDHRWDRTQRAFETIAVGLGPTAETAATAIEESYALGTTDEFIIPTVILGPDGHPTQVLPGDQIIAFNFRSDRLRQLTAALSENPFAGFERGSWIPNAAVTTLTRYDENLPTAVVFPPQDVDVPLARVLSEAGFAQFHCAETEKYAHVTYFFNGGREEPFPGESRALVPSPHVATYDLQPEMSAQLVADWVVAAIQGGAYRFIVVNFANCDMVGHTGVLSAAITAAETVDACLARVLDAVMGRGGVALVTADHGNAEEMIVRETGAPFTAHTTNPVPFILVAPENHPCRSVEMYKGGMLASVTPTIIRLFGLAVPTTMTAPPLL